MSDSWLTLNDDDRLIWEDELAEFVPSRIFDAHVHLLDNRHLAAAKHTITAWQDTDFKTLKSVASQLYPGREIHFLVLGTPLPGIDVRAHNDWIADQISCDRQSRMNRLVTPQCTVAELECDLQTLGYLGLKPYRLFSSTGDPHQCRISDFLPHEQLQFANDHGLWVTMHLSRFHGCGDELNLADLHDFTTQRYPNVRWILAHCARSFTYWPIRQGIERLRDMPNIWYDVSAVTDVRPLITLFTKEATKRVYFGSDAVDSTHFHGKYVSLGRAWQGLNVDRFPLEFPHCDGRPILAIYEQLLAMKHAAEIAQLSESQVEDIFWRNASRAFDVEFDET